MLTHDQTANGVPGHAEVVVGAEQVDLVVGQHNARLGHILDGHLHPPIFARNASDRPAQVVAAQGFH